MTFEERSSRKVLKFEYKDWVVTASLAREYTLERNAQVEIKQEGNCFSVESPAGELIKAKVVSIQYVVYVA